jgi:hypothetical protein
MRLALAKDLKRKREGKDTEFEINGRLLPREKMQRFMTRKELSEEDVIRSDARKSTSTSSRVPLLTMKATPPYVTYHTPRPVEHDDVTDTLASISLGKDEIMADTYVTYDERTENLHDHSKTFQPDEQHEERASTSVSILSSTGEFSENNSKTLERNEAWLDKRSIARNDPTLLFAYARLILTCKKQGSIISRKLFPIWKSYIARRQGIGRFYSLNVIPPYECLSLLDFFSTDFESLEKSLLASYVFHDDWTSCTSLDSAPERSEQRWKNRLLPSTTTEDLNLAPIATNQSSDHDELLLMPLLNSPAPGSDFIRDNIRRDPFHELQRMPTASPFELGSQRYDISSSPNWIRSYMSPSNPLLLLTPAPIGTPWGHIPKPSPRPTGSQGHGSRVFNSDHFLADDDISGGLHDQAKIEDVILFDKMPYSGEAMELWPYPYVSLRVDTKLHSDIGDAVMALNGS